MKILNLMAGIGGNRKLWGNEHEITAVEINPDIAKVYKEFFSNDTVIIGDGHQFLLDHYQEFDFVWSSPACQPHSKMTVTGQNQTPKYFDLTLYQEIIFLQKYFKGKWIVENVVPYYKPLINYSFRIGRHLFWSNFQIGHIYSPKAGNFINEDDPKELMKWLDMYYDGNIYYNGNHSPAQVLRNAVHPKIGEQILNYSKEKTLFT